MKNLVLMSLIALSVAPAVAAETYVGASVGRAGQELNAGAVDVALRSTSATLFAGYEFDNGLGVEAGYTRFGKASTSGGNTAVSLTPKSYYAAMTGRIAFANDFSGFAKLGVARPGTTGYASHAADSAVFDTRRVTPMIGVGVGYALAKQVAVIAEYEYYGKAINEQAGSLKLDNLSVGVRYSF